MREPKTEGYLARGNWTWVLETVPIAKVDLDHAKDNPTRMFRRFDPERVLQYAEQMADGVEFPAVVLMMPSDLGVKPYDVATGLHRLSAAETAKIKTFEAYVVVEPDPYRRELLARSLNSIEGRGSDQREQIMHIIALHEKHRHPIATLCNEWHVKESSVRHHYRAELSKRRARRVGGSLDNTRLRLSQTLIGQLHAIHSDAVFGDVVNFATHHASSPAAVEQIWQDVRHVRDEAKALAIVQEHIASEKQNRLNARAKFGRTRPGPAHAMIANATRFVRHAQATGINQLALASLSGQDKLKTMMLMEEMRALIQEISGEIGRIDKIKAELSGLHAAE